MEQMLARRTIDREVESLNQASDSDKCHRVAKGRGPLLANTSSSTEMRRPPALSLPTLTLMSMGDISISIIMCINVDFVIRCVTDFTVHKYLPLNKEL